MNTIRRILAVAAMCGLACLVWQPSQTAQAQERSIRVQTIKSATPNGKPAVALVVNGEVVAQLAKDQRSRTPLHNISVAAALITAAYRNQEAELTVKATDQSGRRYALFLNGRVLLVATDMEGKAWGAEPSELADTWRQNLLDAWDLMPPAAESEPVVTPDGNSRPAGETVTPAIEPALASSGGTLSQSSAAMRADPTLANLTISNGHNVHEPPAHTMFDGADVPGNLMAQITGSRHVEENVKHSIESALRGYVKAPASLEMSWKVLSPANGGLALSPGQKLDVKVSYQALAGQAGVGTANIQLENRVLSVPRESLTYFSNAPEQVRQPQLLYYADLPARQAGRLVYHHQNQNAGKLTFVARLVNTSNQPAAVHVIPGTSAPDINTFYVGFRSAEVFWHNLNSGSGYVVSVPANGQASLVVQQLAPGYTGSGYFKLSNLGDIDLRLETLALAPGTATPSSPWANDSAASYSVYPAPYHVMTASYEAGDPWLYLRLGDSGPASQTDGKVLDGCYGMTHSYHVELHNPRSYPALVFAVLRASAGEVKGQFFINDEYVATPLVVGGEEQLLKEIPLKPGETRLLKIKAIPLNGGFYPASIILRESRYP